MRTDLAAIAADLDSAADTITRRVAPTVKKGATDIATQAREAVRDGSQHDRDAREFAARNLGYDTPTPTQTAIEVGYNRQIEPNLALSLEYGSANAAPGDHLGQALRRELPDFSRVLARIGARLWR